MKAKRIMLLAAVLFFGVFTLSAQTKDEVKADKAKARKEIPAYRQKGYAGNASLFKSYGFSGLDTSHGYMFNEHHYLGAGANYSICDWSWRFQLLNLYVDYKAYVLKRRSTLTAGLKAGYPLVALFDEGKVYSGGASSIILDPNIGWDWGLKSGYGLTLSLGIRSWFFIDEGEFFPVELMPFISFGFQF